MQTSSFSEPPDAVRAAHHQIGNALERDFVRGGGTCAAGFGPRLIDRLVGQMHGSHRSAIGPFGTLTTIEVQGPIPDGVTS